MLKKLIIYILTLESKLVLKKYKPRIIAVTGSVGKTSTKDAIYAILAATGKHVRKSDKSFNSEIGVPLTILGVGNAWKDPLGWFSNILHGLEIIFLKVKYPDILVLEVGADHPGDIENLIKWMHPDVAVITKIGDIPVHVEFFDSPEAILKEKLFLVKGVPPGRAGKEGGAVVLYADDKKLKDLKFEGRKVMTYGMDESALVKGSMPTIIYGEVASRKLQVASEGKHDFRLLKPTGISFKLDYAGNSVPVSLENVLGVQHIYPILAAVAVGLVQGLSLAKIVQGLSLYNPPRGRMNIIDGLNDSTIIDDSYNSSPTAVAVALGALADIEGAKNKIAILGDMMELGKYSAEEHHKVGALVAKSLDSSGGDLLITVGQRAKGIRDGAVAVGFNPFSIISFDSSAEAAEKVKSMIKSGDVVLVKGSQSPRMERITKSIMADPSRAPELLVRQEKEWLEKL
jgi:UDP-N-acetylmuramoyl-tripeptide--D-alanyl-D-alanine ligase